MSQRAAEYQLYSGDNIYISKETVANVDSGILMRKSLPHGIKNKINRSIRHIIETGLIQHIRGLYDNRMKIQGSYPASVVTYQPQSTSLSEVTELFMLLSVGVVLSSVVLVVEGMCSTLSHIRWCNVLRIIRRYAITRKFRI